MAADRWDEQVGSVADEAARLLESLRRASEASEEPAAEPGAEPRDDVPGRAAPADPGAGHDPFCQWCPLCRSAAVVRSLSPETLARLADLAVVAAGVLADLAARGGGSAPPTGGPSGAPERDRARGARTPPPTRPVPVVDVDEAEEGPHA